MLEGLFTYPSPNDSNLTECYFFWRDHRLLDRLGTSAVLPCSPFEQGINTKLYFLERRPFVRQTRYVCNAAMQSI